MPEVKQLKRFERKFEGKIKTMMLVNMKEEETEGDVEAVPA